jgi:hypothetical protein
LELSGFYQVTGASTKKSRNAGGNRILKHLPIAVFDKEKTFCLVRMFPALQRPSAKTVVSEKFPD